MIPVLGRRLLHPSLWQQVPRDHRQSPKEFRRRQLVTLLFVLIGGAVLGWSLRLTPGSSTFIVATLVLAGVWAVGAFASGPLYLGRIDVSNAAEGAPLPRPVVQPILIGLGLAAVFVVGGLVVHQIGPLDRQVTKILEYADQGVGPLVLLVTVAERRRRGAVLPGRRLRGDPAQPGRVVHGHLRDRDARHRQRDARLRRRDRGCGGRAAAARVAGASWRRSSRTSRGRWRCSTRCRRSFSRRSPSRRR